MDTSDPEIKRMQGASRCRERKKSVYLNARNINSRYLLSYDFIYM